MKKNYAKALKAELVYEGGKVDDPRDPGGRTNQGIIQRVYNAFRIGQGQPIKDVYDMAPLERDTIYKRQYWDVIKGDELPSGVDLVVFDGAVNSGCAQSIKWLQRAVGLTADGHLGMVTLEKVLEQEDADALIEKICAARLDFLDNLKTWKTYGKGWSARVRNVKAIGQAWAYGSVGPAVEYSPHMKIKAMVSDAKKIPTRTPADITTGVGGALTLSAQAVSEAKNAVAPAADLGYASNILIALTIAGVVITLAGLAYRVYIGKEKRRIAHALGNQAT